MKEEPLFSVLIANYNNGRFLQEAIDSVFAQTYTNWEIVIVDDKSTDDSFEIYEKYKANSRFHIFYNEKNEGCGFTKRRCAEMANGEACGFLDPDDVLMPKAIEVSVKNLTEHPDSVLSFSRFLFCDENLNILRHSRLLKLEEGETYLEHGDYCPESFASFLREGYFKTGGINSYLRAGVDQDLYFRLEEVGHISVVDEVTYKYRLCQGSVSHDGDYALFWNWKVRFDAFERRNLLMGKDSVLYKSFHIRLVEEADKVRATKAYRLGKFLLKPFAWIKR